MPPKPLVFVPGLPGTVIFDQTDDLELFPSPLTLLNPNVRQLLVDKLSGPDDPNAGDGVIPLAPVDTLIKGLKSSFIDFSGSLKLADSLYAILQDLGYANAPAADRFRPVGWDWRRPVDQARALGAVKAAIDDLHNATGEKVVILCHSTGGLVTRSLLESDAAIVDKVDSVLGVAVPWVGTLQTLPYLAGQMGFFPLPTAETQHILGRSWAAFDLLPPDPARTDMTHAGADLNFFTTSHGQAGPAVETAWMPPDPAMPPRAARSNANFGKRERSFALQGKSLEMVCFAGWGADTLTGCQMDAQGRLSFTSGDEGDGTIPGRSADWLSGAGVTNFLVPVGHYQDSQITREHSALWMNPPIRDLLGTLLAGKPRQPYVYAAVDGDDATNPATRIKVRMVAQDTDGKALTGALAVAFPGTAQELHSSFNGEARLLMPVPRGSIVQELPGGLLRFEMEIRWQEAGQARSSRQVLLVNKV